MPAGRITVTQKDGRQTGHFVQPVPPRALKVHLAEPVRLLRHSAPLLSHTARVLKWHDRDSQFECAIAWADPYQIACACALGCFRSRSECSATLPRHNEKGPAIRIASP